ncbi:MAG: SDR family oxidoreductase [Gammaproteobacteria bacterium]
MRVSELSRRLLSVFFIALVGLIAGCAGQGSSANEQPVVLVAGATGGTGKPLVANLQSQGYTVRVFVRDETKARGVLGDGVEYAVGDVRKVETFRAALANVDYVISAIGSSRGDPSNNPEAVDYQGVKNMATAAADARVKQFVLVSSSGVTQEDHFLNKAFNNVLIWKFKGEEALRNSGVPYTIVRPGGLVNKPGGQEALVFSQGDKTTGIISREDVALICIAALQTPEAVNKTFETFSSTEPGDNNWEQLYSSLQAD